MLYNPEFGVEMKRIRNRKNSAFTLVEILAVTLLMAGLVGMAALGIASNVKKGKMRTATAQIGAFDHAISLFEMECGSYPTNLQDLVTAPSSKCKDYPKEGYLSKKDIPLDPWNNDYNYRKPGTHNPSTYDLWSSGPDGEDGSGDDIGNWKADTSSDSEAK